MHLCCAVLFSLSPSVTIGDTVDGKVTMLLVLPSPFLMHKKTLKFQLCEIKFTPLITGEMMCLAYSPKLMAFYIM